MCLTVLNKKNQKKKKKRSCVDEVILLVSVVPSFQRFFFLFLKHAIVIFKKDSLQRFLNVGSIELLMQSHTKSS